MHEWITVMQTVRTVNETSFNQKTQETATNCIVTKHKTNPSNVYVHSHKQISYSHVLNQITMRDISRKRKI